MSITVNGEIYLNSIEAAKFSGRTRNTVYQTWKKWGWTSYRFGSTILFKQSEIHDWLVKQIVKG